MRAVAAKHLRLLRGVVLQFALDPEMVALLRDNPDELVAMQARAVP